MDSFSSAVTIVWFEVLSRHLPQAVREIPLISFRTCYEVDLFGFEVCNSTF